MFVFKDGASNSESITRFQLPGTPTGCGVLVAVLAPDAVVVVAVLPLVVVVVGAAAGVVVVVVTTLPVFVVTVDLGPVRLVDLPFAFNVALLTLAVVAVTFFSARSLAFLCQCPLWRLSAWRSVS